MDELIQEAKQAQTSIQLDKLLGYLSEAWFSPLKNFLARVYAKEK